MGKSLSEYGWKMPWSKPYYLNKQLKQAATNPNLLFSASKYEAMEETLEKAGLKDSFPSDFSMERICIYDVKKNQFMSVFYHIRNSLAHGRLNMVDIGGECIFILEDFTGRGKDLVKVSARMILRKNTLLKWIEIIENGQCEYRER